MRKAMPLDIELLLVAYHWLDPTTHPLWDTEPGKRSRKWLEREGLLDGEHVTQRGVEYIDRLLAVSVDPPCDLSSQPDEKDTRGFATPRTWSDVVDTGVLQAQLDALRTANDARQAEGLRVEKLLQALTGDVNLFEARLDALAKTMVRQTQVNHMARVIEKQERQLQLLSTALHELAKHVEKLAKKKSQ